jgi:hypothetical protein
MLTPVVWIPLKNKKKSTVVKNNNERGSTYNFLVCYEQSTYKAAPTTESATDRPIPTVAHI